METFLAIEIRHVSWKLSYMTLYTSCTEQWTTFSLAEKAKFLRRRDAMSEWVERFLKEGAAADLDDLGVEVDDLFLDHLELEEVRPVLVLMGLLLRNPDISHRISNFLS